MKNTKKSPDIYSFLSDREGEATENFNFSLLGGSNFALGRGAMFWGVSLWASPPRTPPLAHVCLLIYRKPCFPCFIQNT